jgi:phage tail sheath protein FI
MVELNKGPGVYTTEAPPAPGPIAGTSASGLGLIGFTKRGVTDVPTLCVSMSDFTAKFGSYTGDSITPTVATAFFANGGQQLWVCRTVHSDAASATVDWTKQVTGEVLTSTATVSGAYSLSTAKIPIVSTVAASIQIEFEAAVTNNIFRDDGAGNLAFYAAGSGGAGGTASFDPETGEISVQLTNPGDYAGGADDVTITYYYKVVTYDMAWPGLEGNYFRVRVTGSPDYYDSDTASYSAFTLYVEENITPTSTATWEAKETFDALVFDDSNDPNYFVTVINDVQTGSDLITITDYGNAQDIASLAGSAVADEDFAAGQAPAYDGSTKAFSYTLPTGSTDGVAPGTLSMAFKFREIGWRIGTGDGTAAPACTSLGAPVDIGGGTPASAKVTVNLTLGIAGAITLYDDGAGNLKTSPFPGTTHGTMNYTTGAVTLTVAADTVVAGSAITISAVYEDVVTVADDGNGNMELQAAAAGTSPPSKFILNTAGTNEVDCDTGVVSLTWKISGAPSAGPAGVGASLGATAATKTMASPTYAMVPAFNFDLDVDNVGIASPQWDAAAGYIIDDTVYPVANQIGLTLTITLNGGAGQLVTFVGATTTAQNVIDEINPQIVGGYAVLNGGQVQIVSDQKGTGSSVAVALGTSTLSFGNPAVAGTGDVDDITAVTALEIKTVIEADTTATVDITSGVPIISSPTTGVLSELDFSNPSSAPVFAALGLATEVIVGTTGTTVAGEAATYYTAPSTEVTYTLTGGANGSATDRNDVSAASLDATGKGLYSFKKVNDNMQMVIADFQTDEDVCRDLIGFCELVTDKFAIICVPEGLTAQEAVNWKKNTLARYSNYAALYYPHIRITDPFSGNRINIPAGGHVAGIYAKTDNNYNVAKAPAGVRDGALSYFDGLEASLTKLEVGYANQNNVNCIVNWPETGTAVWGARTIEIPGGDMPYIQMRRTFMYVKKAIYNATQIHVFQNNNALLWNAIQAQVSAFLRTLTDADYFASRTYSQAFKVVCDSTNNNTDTIDLGLVFCDVGLALNRPGEFIVFTFSQLTSTGA